MWFSIVVRVEEKTMLTDEQKILSEIVQEMEPAQVRELLDFARKLRQVQPVKEHGHEDDLDYSDTWSDEDIEDWRRSGLAHMEQVCPHDDDPLEGGNDAQSG